LHALAYRRSVKHWRFEMNKIHVTVVALILGVSGALGVAAATRTTQLRTPTAHSSVSDAAIAARAHRLDKVARDIGRARRDRPPALPAVPAARRASGSRAQRIVYQRPAPVVVVRHNGHHESESEPEHESGGEQDD
jgi:hypothetical protein